MYQIGIMQGRLSPMIDDRVQAFPTDTWREEFTLARDCGFSLMEWVLDLNYPEENPLFSEAGRNELRRIQNETGVVIPSVCCDYFMEHYLAGEAHALEARGMLLELCRVCPDVGINLIELPLIGKAGLQEESAPERIAALLNILVPLLEAQDIFLLLETDLMPTEVAAFLGRVPSPRIQINYDTGNSTYWEFKAEEEIPLYGNRIGNVHIKDCTPKDYSVPLGQGNVDFDLTFDLLAKSGYKGDFILQTARGEDDVNLAKQFRDFTAEYVSKYFL